MKKQKEKQRSIINQRSIRLSIFTMTITAMIISSSIQDDSTKKTKLDNYYVRLMSWNTAKPSIEKTRIQDAQNFVLNISLTTTGSKLPLVPDFGAKRSFVGLQTLNNNDMSDVGIQKCTGDNGCKVLNDTFFPASYNGSEYDAVAGTVRISLDSDQTLAKNDIAMNINLMVTKKAEAPLKSGFGVLGMKPDSDFINYICNAFEWPDDTVTMKLWTNSLLNGYANDWWDPGYYDGSQLSFNLLPNESRVTKDTSTYMPMVEINGAKPIWGLKNGSLNIITGDGNPISIIDQKNVCFIPNAPLTFYFKATPENNGPYTKMLHAVNQHLCGSNDNCDTETKWIRVGYKLDLKFGDNEFMFSPIDYMWNDKIVIRPGFENRTDYFSDGGICEGYEFAIGARVISKWSFNMKMKTDKSELMFALAEQDRSDYLPPIRSFWMYVYLGTIGLFLYAMVISFIFKPSRRVNKKDGNESSFSEPRDDDIVGYKKARTSDINALMEDAD